MTLRGDGAPRGGRCPAGEGAGEGAGGRCQRFPPGGRCQRLPRGRCPGEGAPGKVPGKVPKVSLRPVEVPRVLCFPDGAGPAAPVVPESPGAIRRLEVPDGSRVAHEGPRVRSNSASSGARCCLSEARARGPVVQCELFKGCTSDLVRCAVSAFRAIHGHSPQAGHALGQRKGRTANGGNSTRNCPDLQRRDASPNLAANAR